MKKKVYSYNRIDRDVSPAKQREGTYFDAQNIRIVMNDDAFSVTNIEGNSLSVTMPSIENAADKFIVRGNGTITQVPYVHDDDNNLNSVPHINYGNNTAPLYIIGHCYIRDVLVILATAYNGSNPTGDSAAVLTVFTWDGTTLSLKYCNSAGVSRQYPMRRVVSRYENEKIQKIYFTDGFNQLRILNIADDDTINIPPELLDINPSADFSDIEVTNFINGGSFEQGIVQYAYSLYSDNGTESKISSLSLPYLVDNTVSVGNKSLEVSLSNIDSKYDYIKVYRVLYDTIEGTPVISQIADQRVTENFSFVDDGSVVIANIPVEDFLFLGGDPFVCKDIAIKDNRLVAANIKETFFEVDYDARAFRFTSGSPSSLLFDEANTLGDTNIVPQADGKNYYQITAASFANDIGDLPDEHDCINPSNKAETNIDFRQARYTHDTTLNSYQDLWYNSFIYQKDGTTLGGEGLNVSYKILTATRVTDNEVSQPQVLRAIDTFKTPVNYFKRSFKRDEIYRFAIRFKNKFGQYSFPKWIGDIRMPNQDTHPISPSNTEIDDLYVEFTVNNVPSNAIGWEILRVERDQANSTILTQAYITDSIRTPLDNNQNKSGAFTNSYFPRLLMGTWNNKVVGTGVIKADTIQSNLEYDGLTTNATFPSYKKYMLDDNLIYLYSPEITEKDVSLNGEYLNFIGVASSFAGGRSEYQDSLESINSQFNWNYTDPTVISASMNDPIQYLASNESRYRSFYRKATVSSTLKISKINIESQVAYTESAGFKTLSSNNRADKKISFQSGFKESPLGNTTTGLLDNETSIVVDIYNGTFGAEGVQNILSRSGNYLASNPTNLQDLFIMVDYKQTLSNQYGGDTYEAIQRTQYFPTAKYTGTNATIDVRNGDTFVGMWTFTKTKVATPVTGINDTGCRDVLMLPIESRYNIDMYEYQSRDTISEHEKINYDAAGYNKYNKVFHREPNVINVVSKPHNFVVNNTNDSRIKISQAKINAEVLDSFADFRELDFFDVNSSFGPITGIMEYNNQIYFFQPEGVGIIQISPRIQTVGSDGVSIALGTGSLLQDEVYISTNKGCSHQFSLVKSEYGIYFYDYLTSKFCLVRGNVEPISDMKGLHSWFMDNNVSSTDNPVNYGGVTAGYSREKNEIYMTFWKGLNDSYTVLYSEYVQGFVSFVSNAPTLYIPWRDRLFTTNSTGNLYEENVGNKGEFGGVLSPSYITLTLNPSPLNTCIFDTIAYNSQVTLSGTDQPLETLTNIQCFNQYQDSGLQAVDAKRKFREWRVNIPREQNTRNRMRSQHAYLKLQYNNASNKELVLEDIILNYRDAPASFV